MTSTRTRSVLLSVILCLTPAIALILSPAAEAAKKEKAKPAAAKKKAAPSSSDTKKTKTADTAVVPTPPSAASQAWEPPPKGDLTKVPTPPPPPPETKPAPEPAPAAAPPAAPAAAPVATPPPPVSPPVAPSGESPAAPPTPAPEPEEETMPALVPPPPPQYVEHLGPNGYPGKMRGLYGGSLWLEPSFHGLQWPYVTRTGVAISGSAWVDSGYEKLTSENANVPNASVYLQQARAVLRVTPAYVSGRFFIQAQAELVANGCQSTGDAICDQGGKGTVDTDDLWLRVGHWNIWDLKVGRFEGWEIYHTGMGLDINTLERRGAWALSGSQAPDYYGVTWLHDRPSQGMGLGYAALHYYPLSVLRFELLGELGTDNVAKGGNNYLGGRPCAIYDLGWLKVKAGAEYQSVTAAAQIFAPDPTTGATTRVDDKTGYTRKGLGAAFQFVFDPYVEFGGNIGRSYVKQSDQNGNSVATGSYTTTSVGGFANVRVGHRGSLLEDLLVGGGVDWTAQYDDLRVGNNSTDYSAHLQIFGAIQYLVAKQIFVKAVLAYARADFDPSGATGSDIYSNTMLSARVRLMYLY